MSIDVIKSEKVNLNEWFDKDQQSLICNELGVKYFEQIRLANFYDDGKLIEELWTSGNISEVLKAKIKNSLILGSVMLKSGKLSREIFFGLVKI